MTTFDEIVPKLIDTFRRFAPALQEVDPVLVNRDLSGRVRLVVDERFRGNETVAQLAHEIESDLDCHAFSAQQAILFEPDIEGFLKQERTFRLADDLPRVFVVDRLPTEGDWGEIALPCSERQRIVFYSMKGGVGRSTALAVASWALAERGHRVMVIDLDVESPGLSSSLLPADRRPVFGVTDWLVEDLVDNGNVVINHMVAASDLSRNGEILVAPAHGATPGEYLAKLGRVWMPKLGAGGKRESWSRRLGRLLETLENEWSPDVVLIDSRAGIDEAASTCLTDLGASLILLFAVDGDQTWAGYEMLFQFWRRRGVVQDIRERLQLVASLAPETGTAEYLEGLRERAWNLFSEQLYDEVPPGASDEEYTWSFDVSDADAPHSPWRVNWHRGFFGLQSIHGRLGQVQPGEVEAVFGPLLAGIAAAIGEES